ncbi:hypothetical protein AB0D46_31825 [Streptomyces sp. NPDC048383]|uniref:hypothetical protein n=1 Tax=Streptomyces sp. NPDC048383 TaxID=3155386 RepID=UPI00343E9EF4
MTSKALPWASAGSVLGWWAVLTGLLWLAGTALDGPAPLGGCAASAAVLVAVGEAGDWVRRRWTARPGSRPPR